MSRTLSQPAQELTVLFADIRGFTQVSEQQRPEETVQLLNDFFTAMHSAVLAEGGTVDKYIGDRVMVLFTDPPEDPPHAERACRTALTMQQSMPALLHRWREAGWRVEGLGIGFASGTALLGRVGSPARADYTAIGSIVNLASRLADLAAPGQTLTTWKTSLRVRHAFSCTAAHVASIKGFTRPVELVAVSPSLTAGADGHEQAIATHLDAAPVAALPPQSVPWTQPQAELAVPLLDALPATEVAALLGAVQREMHPAGTRLVHQGASADKFFLLLQGEVLITVAQEADEVPVARLGPGDCFGEVALLFDLPRTATARTIRPSLVLALEQTAFYEVLQAAPALAGRIRALAHQRLWSSTRQAAPAVPGRRSGWTDLLGTLPYGLPDPAGMLR